MAVVWAWLKIHAAHDIWLIAWLVLQMAIWLAPNFDWLELADKPRASAVVDGHLEEFLKQLKIVIEEVSSKDIYVQPADSYMAH